MVTLVTVVCEDAQMNKMLKIMVIKAQGQTLGFQCGGYFL